VFKLGSSKSDFAKDLLDNGQSMWQIENFLNINVDKETN